MMEKWGGVKGHTLGEGKGAHAESLGCQKQDWLSFRSPRVQGFLCQQLGGMDQASQGWA